MPPSCKNTRNPASAHKAIQLDLDALSQAKKKHLKAPKTTQVYGYTMSTARKWLQQVIFEARNSTSSTITSTVTMEGETGTPNIFLHPLAASAFDVPTEVTAQIIAQYVSHWVITQKMSKSTGDTTHAAFKAYFNDWYAFKTWSACQITHFPLVGSEVHGSQIRIPSCVRVTRVTVQMWRTSWLQLQTLLDLPIQLEIILVPLGSQILRRSILSQPLPALLHSSWRQCRIKCWNVRSWRLSLLIWCGLLWPP